MKHNSDTRTYKTLNAIIEIDGKSIPVSNTTLRHFCRLIIDDIECGGEIRGLFGALHNENYWQLALSKET